MEHFSDFSWIATEAKSIHLIFKSMFYTLITIFLGLGVLIEYFKLPIGGMPAFGVLVGRSFIAAFLLMSLPEVMNYLSEFTESLSSRIGDLNNMKLVLARMSETLDESSWSLLSVKRSFLMIISFCSFLLLSLSVYLSEAFYIYAWVLIYIFSPVLIALFVFPQTSGATKSMYRSLIEVACWKPVWAIMSTLMWSAALVDLEALGKSESFISVILFNIMLSVSVLMTPLVVRALVGGGIANLTQTAGAAAVGSVLMMAKTLKTFTPLKKVPGANIPGKRGFKKPKN